MLLLVLFVLVVLNKCYHIGAELVVVPPVDRRFSFLSGEYVPITILSAPLFNLIIIVFCL